MLDENLSRTFWSTINSTIRHRDQPVFWKNIFPWMSLSSPPYKRYINSQLMGWFGQREGGRLLWKRCLTFNKVLLIFFSLRWVSLEFVVRGKTDDNIVIKWVADLGWVQVCRLFIIFLSWKPTKNAESRFSVSIIPMWQFSVQFFIYVVTHGDVNPGVRCEVV